MGDCRVKVFESLKNDLLGGPAPSVQENKRILPTVSLIHETSSNNKPQTVAPPPPKGPVVRIFPKANLTRQEAIALAKLLPDFSIQLGKSQIDPSMYADTLSRLPVR